MFTGITTLGQIIKKEHVGQDLQLTIASDFNDIQLGESIAVNGVCLTVTQWHQGTFTVHLSQETLRVSNFKKIQQQDKVNLEQSIKMGDRLDGHWVLGHVDAITKINALTKQGRSHVLRMSIPQAYAPFIAAKGSVTLDGISLTVNSVSHTEFTVNIIPHTWQVTALQHKRVGDELNLEVDILARYMQRLLQTSAVGDK